MGSYRKKVTSFQEASTNFAAIDAYIRNLNRMIKRWRKSGIDDLAHVDTRRLKLKKNFGRGGGVTKPGGPPAWP